VASEKRREKSIDAKIVMRMSFTQYLSRLPLATDHWPLTTGHYPFAVFPFFGFVCVWWQRLQRVRCVLIAPPHFGQRRLFFFITNLVRGRVRMEIASLIIRAVAIFFLDHSVEVWPQIDNRYGGPDAVTDFGGRPKT
jgi:hypothetical protein